MTTDFQDHYEHETDGLAVKPKNPLYAVKGMPQKGWIQTDEIDLGSPSQRCQWCDARIIRYVCKVEHPDGHHAEVGRVCCGTITGQDGEDHHLEFKERRANFTRKWKHSKSKQGNYRRVYHAPDGRVLYLTCYRKAGAWKVCIKDRDNEADISFWTKEYATLLAAKEAMFFYFEHQRRHKMFQDQPDAPDAPEITKQIAKREKENAKEAPEAQPEPDLTACSGLSFHQRTSLLFGFDVKDWKAQPDSVQNDVRALANALRKVLKSRGADEGAVPGMPDARWNEFVGEARNALRASSNDAADWRSHPATPKQIAKLKSYGETDASIRWDVLTKGDASDLIRDHINRLSA